MQQKMIGKVGTIAVWLSLTGGMLFAAAPVCGQSEENPSVIRNLSDTPALRFNNLGIKDGMAQSSANNIMQDSQGYLWITTQGGLHRYDGYEFKLFSSIPFDTTSLSDDYVWTVTESRDGGLWITTEVGGLNYMDRTTGAFKHYKYDPEDPYSLSSNTVYHVLESSLSDLWVSTLNGGLNRMRAGREGEFIDYWHDIDNQNSLSSDILYWLSEDADGQIWASSANGINKIDPETELVTRYLYDSLATPDYGEPQNVFGQYVHPDEPGFMWLATGNGLVRLQKKTGTYERFLIEPDIDGVPNPANLIHGVVQDPDNSNMLWVAGPGTGLARFDISAQEFTRYKNDPTDANSLPDDFSQSLFVDRSGTIWVGHTTEGLSSFNPQAVKFLHFSHDNDKDQSLAPGLVWGIYEERNGSLWTSSELGVGGSVLTHFNANTSQIAQYRHDPNDPGSLLPGIIWGFAENETGDLWVAGDGGLSLFNTGTGSFTHFLHDLSEENWGRNHIFKLYQTQKDANLLWVGSMGGLDIFNTITKEFTRVDITIEDEEFDPAVLSLFEDENNTLWFGSSFGLMRYDSTEGTSLVSFYDPSDPSTISGNEIESVHGRTRDPGVLWLAPFNRGLNRYDIETGVATHYTTEHGLPNNTVYGILEDDKGTLWLSTNAGISNFDPDTETFRNYGLGDGLNTLEFNQGAYAIGRGGVLYFGSAKGVTSFIPGELHINEIPPQMAITDFRLFNESVSMGPGSPLTGPLHKITDITLRHHQNEIGFEFVAFHFANPAKNRYAYKLDGYDPDWVEAGSQRLATYTNVDPGSYRFRVKASNAYGVWNNQDTSIQLTVLSPWWRTWWAYGFYLILFVAGVFTINRFQRQRILRKERDEAREKELKQAKEIEKAYRNLEVAHKDLKAAQDQLVQQEKLASLGQLTAGIAHEIKNPLNFVNNFSDVSLEMIDEALEELATLKTQDIASQKVTLAETEAILADIKANLAKIYEHGSRADGIVKSMLMHSRGGDGKMEPTPINPLIKEYVNLAFHGMRAGKDAINVDIDLQLDESIGDVPLIAEDFSRVILNIVNNGFDAMRSKLTEDGGPGTGKKYHPKLTVRTKSESGKVHIEIKDNGPGIPEDIKDNILQPFFTTKKGTQGTGLGLSITHDIIKAHGGILEIRSGKSGTIMVIKLTHQK